MTTFVYTLSSVGRMVAQAVRSIRTLTHFVDPEQVVVFYTPPRDSDDADILRSLGVDLRLVENETEGFSLIPGLGATRYGEKMRLCTIDDDTVVFLDCDTVVAGDIQELVSSSDADLHARWLEPEDEADWHEATGGAVTGYPNTGFLIFRNGAHENVQAAWRRWYGRGVEYYAETYTLEQYALAVAADEAGLNTDSMGPRDHALEWRGEYPADATVYHYSTYSESLVDRVPPTIFGLLPESVTRRVRWMSHKL